MSDAGRDAEGISTPSGAVIDVSGSGPLDRRNVTAEAAPAHTCERAERAAWFKSS
jgi:hypothetical protein